MWGKAHWIPSIALGSWLGLSLSRGRADLVWWGLETSQLNNISQTRNNICFQVSDYSWGEDKAWRALLTEATGFGGWAVHQQCSWAGDTEGDIVSDRHPLSSRALLMQKGMAAWKLNRGRLGLEQWQRRQGRNLDEFHKSMMEFKEGMKRDKHNHMTCTGWRSLMQETCSNSGLPLNGYRQNSILMKLS